MTMLDYALFDVSSASINETTYLEFQQIQPTVSYLQKNQIASNKLKFVSFLITLATIGWQSDLLYVICDNRTGVKRRPLTSARLLISFILSFRLHLLPAFFSVTEACNSCCRLITCPKKSICRCLIPLITSIPVPARCSTSSQLPRSVTTKNEGFQHVDTFFSLIQ